MQKKKQQKANIANILKDFGECSKISHIDSFMNDANLGINMSPMK